MYIYRRARTFLSNASTIKIKLFTKPYKKHEKHKKNTFHITYYNIIMINIIIMVIIDHFMQYSKSLINFCFLENSINNR